MERQLIRQIHAQWALTKRQAEEDCKRAGLPDMAAKYHECSMFRGDETMSELIDLFTTPAGIEFCMTRHFPTIATMRLFDKEELKQHGVYLDAGEITLDNPERAVLIGRTVATIHIDKLSMHQIFLLRNAQATVTASRWGFAKVVAEKGCNVSRLVQDNAIILQ